jgi:hypothetical protein
MRIYDIFQHPIDREYRPVINVGQDDLKNVKLELSEYVVTRELQRHFRDFFRAYAQSVGKTHEKMGVWISGFFGSGKSHLLKIFSYLLENRNVEGRPAISYFTDTGKIADATVIGDIQKAAGVPSDIILFNIGAKADTSTQAGSDTITAVFLRVFNEKLGYCASMPFLADIERRLDEKGRYQAFQDKFEEIEGRPWVEARDEYYFIQDALVKALVYADDMSESAARNTVEKASDTFEMSTEDFAKLVKAYLDKKERDHHLVFMVDEVGQFISENTQMMLNLQNISEDLGRICKGQAWVVVTSQQDMGKALEHMKKKNDFSKIQDRFETRLSLTAANADEVVRKRVLQKKEVAQSALSLFYEQNTVVLKNLLNFSNTVTLPLYSSPASFVSDYPFIPYQFNLMGWVLTAIRENAAVGLNLSSGERSQLALFMQSAQQLKEEKIGVLASVPLFYEALKGFVDSIHATVITRAEEEGVLNDFDVDVLKLLFMIKYIKQIPGNIENLTTMMVSRIDEDRLSLSRKVAASLDKLMRETLIHRAGDVYTFLTNEEQDINRAIAREFAESGEITAYAAQEIYENIYRDRRYRHSARYNFDFNRMVDGMIHGSATSEPLGINVLTPYEDNLDDQALRMRSSQDNVVLVSLPAGNDQFMLEISHAIKLQKYLRKHGVDLSRNHPGIKGAKEAELANIKERISGMLRDALSQADIYVRGEKLQIPGREPVDRMNEALGRQVQHLYFRLGDMQTAPSLNDIEDLLAPSGQTAFELNQQTPNAAAAEDMLQTLDLLGSHSVVKTTLKALMDRYMKAPYGFVPLDVQWLVAWLFARGKINLIYNNQTLALGQTPKPTLVTYLTRQEHQSKLVVELRMEVPQHHKQAGEDFLRKWFGQTIFPTNEDQLMQEFRSKVESKERDWDRLERHYLRKPDLPGSKTLQKAREFVKNAARLNRASAFFQHLYDTREEWNRLHNQLIPVESFLEGNQRDIYEKALLYREHYLSSRAYITDQQLVSIMQEIEVILNMDAPYGEIYKLPNLLNTYGDLHVALLEREAAQVKKRIMDDRQVVLDVLNNSPVKDQLLNTVRSRFNDLDDRLFQGKSVHEIRNLGYESDATKINLLNDITQRTARHQAQWTVKAENTEDSKGSKAQLGRLPVYRHVSMRDLVSASTKLSTPEQVDAYVDQLRGKLLEQLESGEADGIDVML